MRPPDGRIPRDGEVVVEISSRGDDAYREARHAHGHGVRDAHGREPKLGLGRVALVLRPRVVDKGQDPVALERDALRREQPHAVRDLVRRLRGVGRGADGDVAGVVPGRGGPGLERRHDAAAGAAGHGRVGHVGRLVCAPREGDLHRPVLTASNVYGDVCASAVSSSYDLVGDTCGTAVNPPVCSDDSGLEVCVDVEPCWPGVLFFEDV